MIPPPPALSDLPYGTELVAGIGVSTVIAELDFETYSEAGFDWDEARQRWTSPAGAPPTKRGIKAVGAARYAEHPTTEVLCMAYDLKDGKGRRQWLPGMMPPLDLFLHIAAGRLVEAWNVGFERHIWERVCVPRMGWPPIPRSQWRCAMAKARAHALPGALGAAANVLGATAKKDDAGKRLLDRFSVPRNPVKADPDRRRIDPATDPEGPALYAYNMQDIAAEAEVSSRVPDLQPDELDWWQVDQEINTRGVQIDTASVTNCISILDQVETRYNAELRALTGGAVQAASEIARMIAWLAEQGVPMTTLDEEAVEAALARDIPPAARRALQIRTLTGSASVKKLYAMNTTVCADGRLRDLYMFHGARTGRATGGSVQPTNLPNHGPGVLVCRTEAGGCGRHYGRIQRDYCPWCGADAMFATAVEWGPRAVEDALETASLQSLDFMEAVWGEALPAISGCLRGLFVAAPSHDLICSDYSAIEAVVLAELAGETWRQEVFRTHGKIYEMSAAKISGVPFEEIMEHKAKTGQHHPLRKTIGKVAELASGYQGWVGAWKAFGADAFMTDEEMKTAILKWRADSPAIVEFWGGQQRNWRPELFGVEGAFINAVQNPGSPFHFRGHTFLMRGDVLYLQLLSGRYLTYHRPRLSQSDRRPGELTISYEGYNTNPKNGPVGWIRMSTWGGRLTENCIAEGTDVLTPEGWKPIESITKDDLVFDGVDFVSCGGAIHKSVQTCILVDGVWMTPDHQVLSDTGWVNAEDEGYRLYRPEIWDADGTSFNGVERGVADRGNLCGSGFSKSDRRVYDILNAGPRHRFVVRGSQGPFIAHNCVQATARDIQRHGLVQQERAGYRIVLHIYDENVAEIPEGWGSVQEFEALMGAMPAWAADWPIKAAGGWRGKRYRKD